MAQTKTPIVKDWMTKSPYTVETSTHLTKVIALMREYEIRRMPVVEDGKCVGILTEGDIRKATPSELSSLGKYEGNYLLSGMTVQTVMTSNPLFVKPDQTIKEAAEILLLNKIGGLPVIEEGELLGIITVSDLLRFILEGYSV